MMKTCKTCKHWGNDRSMNEDEGERLKSCDAPNITYGYCLSIDNIPDDGAVIEDDASWGMKTGPDFGCVLHEEGAGMIPIE